MSRIETLTQIQSTAKENPALAGAFKEVLRGFADQSPALNQANVAWVVACTDALIEEHGNDLATTLGGCVFVVENEDQGFQANLHRVPSGNFDIAEWATPEWAMVCEITNNSGGNTWLVHKDMVRVFTNAQDAIKFQEIERLPDNLFTSK